jgi:phage baseplate assembly protein gpV
VIGGAIAGIAGWALTSGPARASTMPSTGEQAMKPADPATFERLMKTASAQRAVRTWGPAEQEVLEVSSGSQPVLVLTHPGKDVFTFIDNSPGAMRNGNPTALSMGAAPTAKHALRYYTVDGVPLADVAESGGRVTASPVPVHAVEAVPELKKWQITCFALCVGKKSETAGCIMTCQGCVFDATGTLAKVIACTHCVVCAGPSGVACLKECSAL